MRKLNLLASLFIVFVLSACGGAGGSADVENTSVTQNTPPTVPRVVLTVANDVDTITLAWIASVDDKTLENEIGYNIHIDTIQGFDPTLRNLNQNVLGENQAVITGLSAGTTYYLLIVAVDGDGDKSKEREYTEVTTSSIPVILNSSVSIANAEEHGLGSPLIIGTQYRYPYTGTETLPDAGSILIGGDISGQGLTMVSRSDIINGEVVIETVNGSLSDAVKQAHINNTMMLFEKNTWSNSVSSVLRQTD